MKLIVCGIKQLHLCQQIAEDQNSKNLSQKHCKENTHPKEEDNISPHILIQMRIYLLHLEYEEAL